MTMREPVLADSGSLEANTGYRLWLAANSLQRALRRGLVPLRLTFVQYFALAAVSRLNALHNACSQAQVCRFCGMDPNMLSQVVKTLERKGLLERSENVADRRAFRLALTPAGETLVIAGRERLVPIHASFFAPLGEREPVLDEMLRLVLAQAEP